MGLVRAPAIATVGRCAVWTGSLSGAILLSDGYWVPLTLDALRTIGNGASGANIAQAWAQSLFEHLWNNYNNTECPLLDSSGGAASRGVSATADWAANRRITLRDYRGRAMGAAGSGGGLTARAKGVQIGTETHQLGITETPSHAHSFFINSTAGGGTIPAQSSGGSSVSFTTGTAGSNGAHNNMQPTAFEHWIIAAGVRG